MRLSESKIKEAILHPDAEIRARTVHYFADSFSQDTSVVPLVIQAVEQYGREEAYHLIGASTELAHTDETISWVVDELDREDADKYENYTFNLTRVVCHADPALLVHRDTQIIEAQHFLAGYRDTFLERLEMLAWDEATCWRELTAICEAGKDKRDPKDVNLPRAGHVLEALARIGGPDCETKVVTVLAQKIFDFENNALRWLEPLLVDLAGLLRLQSAAPSIVARLHQDDDILASGCEKALIRIGSDEVVAAVAKQFPGAENHFKLYAAGVIEDIHSDLAAEKCVSLLAQEKERFIQRRLADAALFQFAYGAIEPVRQMILIQRLDGELRQLRDFLVETCEIMGERFPEYDQWKSAGERDRDEHRRQLEEIGDDPHRSLLFALEKAKDYFSGDEDEGASPKPQSPPKQLGLGPTNAGKLFPPLNPGTATKHVGRNDPCPCGSGKKFKKCCMKKQGDEHLFN
jgi:hypothetical protein